MRWIPLVFSLGSLGSLGCASCHSSKAPETKSTAPEAAAPASPVVAGAEAAAPAKTPAKAGAPRVEGQGFVVEVQYPQAGQVGGSATAQVVLKPTSGYHVNKEFPTALEVTPPPGVEVEKAKMAAADAARLEETGAEFAIKFTPRAAGAKKFAATFRFAVCTASTCDPKLETLAWNVDVK